MSGVFMKSRREAAISQPQVRELVVHGFLEAKIHVAAGGDEQCGPLTGQRLSASMDRVEAVEDDSVARPACDSHACVAEDFTFVIFEVVTDGHAAPKLQRQVGPL